MSNDSRAQTLVVLVHGGASSSRMYKSLIPLLSRHKLSCLAPDLPGHGTASSSGPFTFPAAVSSLISTLQTHRGSAAKVVLVGISLGGQTVLALLQHPAARDLVDAAVVSGVSTHPPDTTAPWELPRMPTDPAWVDVMMEDVRVAGWDNMPALQAESFGFVFEPAEEVVELPPTLVVVGEHDTPMARRDYPGLLDRVRALNGRCDGFVMPGAWHNHSIDGPGAFAEVIVNWIDKVL